VKQEVAVNDEDEAAQLIRNVPSAESFPDASIIYILDEGIVEVSENGRSKRTSRVVFKILNERGKYNANITIGFNSRTETASVIYAKTITPEGKTIPLNKNTINFVTPFNNYPSYSDYKTLTFSMPGTTVGSIVDYKVSIEQKNPEIDGKFSDSFYFQTYEPAYFCRYKVITPKDTDLKYLALNPIPGVQGSPKVIHDGNQKAFLWEYRNIPQMIGESFMPTTDEVAFRVLVTTMNSWEEFFNWWRKKIERKTEPDEAIRKKVAELTGNLSTLNDKIEALFDYVKKEIRYVYIDLGRSGYEPHSAMEVFRNKYGDCKDKSTLLISMLKVAGIPAYYVLIPSYARANLIKTFPFPFQFDHCIVAVAKEDGYHFLDPVGEDYRVSYLPIYDQNRGVLIFKDQETVFATTPASRPEENANYIQYRASIRTNGSVTFEGRNLGSGDKEASLRAFYTGNNPTEIKESWEKWVDSISKGAKLIDYSHSNPLNFKESFSQSIKFNAPDYCNKAGNLMIFQLIPTGIGCLPSGKTERRYPLVIRANVLIQEEIDFDIPENYELLYLPEPLEIKNQYFEFRSRGRREGDKIFYRRDFTGKAISIPPEEYPAYQKYCQEMEKSFKRDILFKAK
jgi:transglutaminase-like putative cysteine protease